MMDAAGDTACAGAVLLGTCSDTTYWVATETLVTTVARAKAEAEAADTAKAAAGPIGTPAPSSFLLHAAVALLAVVATLLLVVIVTAAPMVTGHASLPSPFPDPGALGPPSLRVCHAFSLRALAALLARSLLAGYTVAASGAHAAACLVTAFGKIAILAATACASAPRLVAHPLLLLAAPPVGAAAAASFALALIAAALRAGHWLLSACWHSCAGG